jgi:hypothetical protein
MHFFKSKRGKKFPLHPDEGQNIPTIKLNLSVYQEVEYGIDFAVL